MARHLPLAHCFLHGHGAGILLVDGIVVVVIVIVVVIVSSIVVVESDNADSVEDRQQKGQEGKDIEATALSILVLAA